jgi:hypothetical protein
MGVHTQRDAERQFGFTREGGQYGWGGYTPDGRSVYLFLHDHPSGLRQISPGVVEVEVAWPTPEHYSPGLRSRNNQRRIQVEQIRDKKVQGYGLITRGKNNAHPDDPGFKVESVNIDVAWLVEDVRSDERDVWIATLRHPRAPSPA